MAENFDKQLNLMQEDMRMTREKLGTISNLSIERVTFELENWIPMKETPEQNQAYCAVQRMSIMLKNCRKEMGTECSRKMPIDIITLRKSPDVRIENGIGEFFRGLNFIVYPFTKDILNHRILSGILGHIYYFETDFLERKPDGGTKNVTITLLVDGKPASLLEEMESRGTVEEKGDGIFTFNYDMDFQAIVLEELPKQEKAWLERLMNP